QLRFKEVIAFEEVGAGVPLLATTSKGIPDERREHHQVVLQLDRKAGAGLVRVPRQPRLRRVGVGGRGERGGADQGCQGESAHASYSSSRFWMLGAGDLICP